MKRALTNVIENGCRYGESVRVHLSDNGDFISVLVKDNGLGIPPPSDRTGVSPFQAP